MCRAIIFVLRLTWRLDRSRLFGVFIGVPNTAPKTIALTNQNTCIFALKLHSVVVHKNLLTYKLLRNLSEIIAQDEKNASHTKFDRAMISGLSDNYFVLIEWHRSGRLLERRITL
jgi:hypothetical protein